MGDRKNIRSPWFLLLLLVAVGACERHEQEPVGQARGIDTGADTRHGARSIGQEVSGGVGMSAGVLPVATEAPPGNAGLFVGINGFTEDAGLVPLAFAVNDAVEQAYLFVIELRLIAPANTILALGGSPVSSQVSAHLQELQQAGAQITSAKKSSILKALVEIASLGYSADDLILVSFSTHGFEHDQIAYVMPSDGLRSELRETAINVVQTIERRLEKSGAGKRLLLLDACRERQAAGSKGGDQAMSKTFRQALSSAAGQAVLASCAEGQVSYESPELEHGVFTHFLLRALRGEAPADQGGLVRLGSVSSQCSDAVRGWVVHNRPDAAHNPQTPWFKGPKDAEAIPLAIDPGIRAKREAFRNEAADIIDALKLRITLQGEFTPDWWLRVADAVDQAKDDEDGRRLFDHSRGFASGQVPADPYLAYFRQHRPDIDDQVASTIASLPRVPSEPLTGEAVEVHEALRARIAMRDGFTIDWWVLVASALHGSHDEDRDRLFDTSRRFASGQVPADIYMAYLRELRSRQINTRAHEILDALEQLSAGNADIPATDTAALSMRLRRDPWLEPAWCLVKKAASPTVERLIVVLAWTDGAASGNMDGVIDVSELSVDVVLEMFRLNFSSESTERRAFVLIWDRFNNDARELFEYIDRNNNDRRSSAVSRGEPFADWSELQITRRSYTGSMRTGYYNLADEQRELVHPFIGHDLRRAFHVGGKPLSDPPVSGPVTRLPSPGEVCP